MSLANCLFSDRSSPKSFLIPGRAGCIISTTVSEVLKELRDQSNVVPVAIKLFKPGYYEVPSVHYETNLFDAIEHALRSEQDLQ